MQYLKGLKHFDFVPQTFIMPSEAKDLMTTHHRIKGPWIVKPVASSRGRGIYIVNTVSIYNYLFNHTLFYQLVWRVGTFF